MPASSSSQGVTCPGCKSRNPAGSTSCKNCQRYLGTISTAKHAPPPTSTVVQAPTTRTPVARSRSGPVVTSTITSPAVPVSSGTPRPEDGTTRYLCAAAHRHAAFCDSAIAEFLVEEVRAVPPSPGLDSAAVLRDAVAARARRRRRDAMLLSLLALLIVLAPAGAALWLVAGLFVRKARPTRGRIGGRVAGAAATAAAGALVIAVPTTAAVAGIGLIPGAVAALSGVLLTAAMLAVLAADEFAVHRLVHSRFQVGSFEPDFRDAPDGWERAIRSLGHGPYQAQLDRIAAADEYGLQATNRADVIVHRGPSPFIGAGLPLETQTIALPLEPDPARAQGPDDIHVTDLHDYVAAALVSLSSASSLVPGMRLEGILHREQVLIPADGLLANLRTSLGTAALKGLDQPPARHVSLRAARTLAEHPLEWARYYSCFRVESWNRDLATTCYLYAGTDQQMLYLELTHCILPPIMAGFQDIDYVVEFGDGPVCATARELLRLPATALSRLGSLTRRLTPRTKRTRGVIPERYGASRSLREHVAADSKPSSYFLKADATRYVKIVDTKLFDAVGRYLQQCGYDVAEFRRAVRTTINQNSVNISGGNFAPSNFSAGNANTNTTNTTTSGGGQAHP